MAERIDHQDRLNRRDPTAAGVKEGDLLQELIDKHNALCAKLDADVGVTDTDFAATLSLQDLNDR